MEKIVWQESYHTNHGTIDFQHKILVGIINDLIESQWNTVGDELWVEVVLDELKSYTQYHFSTEAHLMKKNNYEDMRYHSEQHAGFIEQLNAFRNEAETGNKKISTDLLEYLKNWLINHIIKEDKKLGSFLLSQDEAKSET